MLDVAGLQPCKPFQEDHRMIDEPVDGFFENIS